MSRRKVINVLAVLLAAGLVVFVLLAPASMARPVSLSVLAVSLTGAFVVIARSVYLARRSARRNRPHV